MFLHKNPQSFINCGFSVFNLLYYVLCELIIANNSVQEKLPFPKLKEIPL